MATVEIDISFFIPCYNEESNVLGAIDARQHIRVLAKDRLSLLRGADFGGRPPDKFFPSRRGCSLR